MPITVSAVYQNGVLRPQYPLPMEWKEGETVEVTVAKAKPVEPLTDEEAARRIKAATSLPECFEIMGNLPPWPDDYDILKALEENRRWSAGLPLLSEKGEGK